MCLCQFLHRHMWCTRLTWSSCRQRLCTKHDETHYDCHAGYSNWYFGWSDRKKSRCCDRRSMGCPGTWHGSYHIHTHVMAHGVGHAQGRIYDCDAGFSRWMTGWSDSKKDWCCNHQSRGCVKFHCTAGGVAQQRVGCWTFFFPSFSFKSVRSIFAFSVCDTS